MSQKSQSDGGQKGFAVGRGLLAAAETLNFSMNEQRSGRQMGGMASGVGMGGGSGREGQEGNSPMSRRGGGAGGSLGSTMKLFASLGLSPSDLDALAQIPEDEISVETLPHLLMQLKSRKGDAEERRGAPSMSSDSSYRGGGDSWDDGPMGRMGGDSLGQSSGRAQASANFGFTSMQDSSSSRSFGLGFGGAGGGGGNRERSYSDLSRRDSYGGHGMGSMNSDSMFMQRRMGSPSQGKIQDFLGVMPTMFPHVCSLCDFDVHSTMEWNQHTNGLRHAENRRLLLNMYPEWDPGMDSNRGRGLLDGPNMSSGLLGPAPISSGASSGGMSSNWGGGVSGMSGMNQHGENKLRSRVVVVKYDRKPLSNKTLFAFTEPFGRLREHLILKNKAFLEMDTHEEAQDVVNYYQQHPASLYGKMVSFYLSKRLMVIEKANRSSDRMDRPVREVKGHGSQVVFFSNLPREDEKKKELLTIAGRFGTVEKHLFLNEEAFIQLGTPQDAEMLVKYYSVNPLFIKGRQVRLNICVKYKTLNVNNRRQGGFGDGRGRRNDGGNFSSGPRSSLTSRNSSSRTSSSSRTREDRKKNEEEKPVVKEKKEKKEEEEKEKKKEEEEEEEKKKEEEEEEEEEEVCGVMEGEEEEEEDGGGEEEEAEEEEEERTMADGDAEEAEPEEADAKMDAVESKKLSVGDDGAKDTPGEGGGAEGDAKPAVKSEPIESETSVKEGENTEQMEAATEEEEPEDLDFPENMEDFVTLDELGEDEDESQNESDSIDNSRTGGMRVVNVLGFRRGYNFMSELLGLAKPFGKVVRHLVLDLRPEAYFQFATEEEARTMAKFYSGNVLPSVCGRPVRISHSMTYPTIQYGNNRVVYIGQIPNIKYSDDDILNLAVPFGKVRKYFLHRLKRECFIEMERAEDAEKLAEHYRIDPPKFSGKRLTVYVSRKYKQLKYGHRRVTTPGDKKPVKREKSSTPPRSSKHPDAPPAKKSKEEEKVEEKMEEKTEEKVEEKTEEKVEEKMEEKTEEKVEEKMEEKPEEAEEKKVQEEVKEKEDKPEEEEQLEMEEEQQQEVKKVEEEKADVSDREEKNKDVSEEQQSNVQQMITQKLEEEVESLSNQNGQSEAPPVEEPEPEPKPSMASLPLPPYDPNTPVGVEHVKMGYYCRVCFLFYSNEDTAKKTHCSSQMHYDKLQKYLEKEKTKTEKKKKKSA